MRTRNVYKRLADIEADPHMIGYVRVLRRAWDEFKLASVYCVNRVPTLYRVNVPGIVSAKTLRSYHHRFWSQGVASILLVVDEKTVHIFSGLQPPDRDPGAEGAVAGMSALVDTLTLTGFHETEFHESVASGAFYRRYADKFRADNSVDHYLSRNLRELCSHLAKPRRELPPLDGTVAHNFICRLLFACYLVDRAICPLPDTARTGPKASLAEALLARDDHDATDYLYDFLKSLKNMFNGSMFEQDLEAERKAFSPAFMGIVKRFLRGDDIGTKQQSLGFWAYDFRLIPVETISGIYEKFLTAEDKQAKGAYYTPRFLAELTLDVATEQTPDWQKARYLDPCCGSGIFLVTLFNRLVTDWELRHKQLEGKPDEYYARKNEALREILRTQIRGMDVNPSACLLTCFSLYVAFLDSFQPADIKTYIAQTGHHRLPNLLSRKGSPSGGHNAIPVVFEDDTLTTTRFKDERFDIVLGNPPWGSEGSRGSKDSALHFLRRTDDLSAPGGKSCLLLPSRLFLNLNNDTFQAEWLADHTVERVVQMADFSFFLFPGAMCPCMIVRSRPGAPADPRHAILYDTPKFNAAARRQGLVLIGSADRKSIPQTKLKQLAAKPLEQAHTLWKRYLWGTDKDQRFLDYLDQFPKLDALTGRTKNKGNNAWVKSQGIIPDQNASHEKPHTAWWQPTHPFIDASSSCLNDTTFLFRTDCEEIGHRFDRLIRSRKESRTAFTPPMVLVSQGFKKVVFCDFPVLFRHALQAIHGPAEDEDLLLFLTAYLKSDLANYYCFHTSSIYGVERDVVRFEELLALPFPLPEDAPARNARSIVQEMANRLRAEKTRLAHMEQRATDREKWMKARADSARKLIPIANELIYDYFDVQPAGRWLVEDTVNVFIPSATPPNPDTTGLPTLQPAVTGCPVPTYDAGLKAYADALTETLNAWAKEQQSGLRVTAEGGIDDESGLAMVRLDYAKKTAGFKWTRFDSGIWKGLFDAFAKQQAATRIERQIIGFLGNSFYVVRPVTLANWTRTAALNDADYFFAREQEA